MKLLDLAILSLLATLTGAESDGYCIDCTWFHSHISYSEYDKHKEGHDF